MAGSGGGRSGRNPSGVCRRQAMSGIVPAKIAASFTMAELAVLTVIGWQCQRAGACVLPIDAIAALAGCSRTTVKNALRQARLLGLILVKDTGAAGAVAALHNPPRDTRPYGRPVEHGRR